MIKYIVVLVALFLLTNISFALPQPFVFNGASTPQALTKTVYETPTSTVAVTRSYTRTVTKLSSWTIVKGSTKTKMATTTITAAGSTITLSTTVTKPETLTVTKLGAAAANCSPTPTASLEEFDIDYHFDAQDSGEPVTVVSHIGTSSKFQWDMVRVNLFNNGAIAGLQARSGLWAAAFSGVTKSNGTPKVSLAKPFSAVDRFDVHSMYFGCVKSKPDGFTSLPASCTITATGFDATGKPVATQAFNYAPEGSFVQSMTSATFDSNFVKLQHIEFAVSNDAFTTAFLDDFVATIYQDT